MFRLALRSPIFQFAFPHTRGDVPFYDTIYVHIENFSPHTWGCSGGTRTRAPRRRLFPTHVGMFRTSRLESPIGGTFPHTRGDVPGASLDIDTIESFSPHTWGCSVLQPGGIQGPILFPTHVGMFRSARSAAQGHWPFPHTRGDVPLPFLLSGPRPPFSPHTWGCSAAMFAAAAFASLFPTHVGMFRALSGLPVVMQSFPHTRGDVPHRLRLIHFI